MKVRKSTRVAGFVSTPAPVITAAIELVRRIARPSAGPHGATQPRPGYGKTCFDVRNSSKTSEKCCACQYMQSEKKMRIIPTVDAWTGCTSHACSACSRRSRANFAGVFVRHSGGAESSGSSASSTTTLSARRCNMGGSDRPRRAELRRDGRRRSPGDSGELRVLACLVPEVLFIPAPHELCEAFGGVSRRAEPTMVLKSLLLNMSEEMTDLLGAFFLLSLLVGAVVVANRTTLLNSIKQSATNSRAESRKAAVRKSLSCPALMELENPQEAVLACAEMFTKFEERAPRASFAGKSMPKTPSLPALVEGSSEGESGLGRAAASSSNSDVDLTDLLGMSGSAAEHAPHVVVLGDARVGKTAVIESLESFDPEGRLRMVEGLPPAGDGFYARVLVALVVWDAAYASLPDVLTSTDGRFSGSGDFGPSGLADGDLETLAEYVDRHMRALRAEPGASSIVRVVVFCNKTDAVPCPLAQAAGLDPNTYFLAGSARRGTNMRNCWRLIETCAAPRAACREITNSGRGGSSASLVGVRRKSTEPETLRGESGENTPGRPSLPTRADSEHWGGPGFRQARATGRESPAPLIEPSSPMRSSVIG